MPILRVPSWPKWSRGIVLYTSEKAVDECAELVADDIIEAVRTDIQNLRGLLDEGDAIAIEEALQQLELSAYRIAESMYGSVEEDGGA